MAVWLPLGAEIFLRLDQAPAEELSPVPVDRDPRRQGILGNKEPERDSQSVSRGIPGQGRKETRR